MARHQRSWLDRLRAGLVGFLGFLDDEPAWGRLLVLETPVEDAIAACMREQRVMGVLTSLLDDGASQASGGPVREPAADPMLTAELVIGGVLSSIRIRMGKGAPEKLVELAPALMSFIVRPYLGQAAARGELTGRAIAAPDAPALAGQLPIRATRRTMLVLGAIRENPYTSNRKVAEAAGLSDEGQISKLLSRLECKGLIENVGVGAARGEPNAWTITPYGDSVVERIASYYALNGDALSGASTTNGGARVRRS